MSGRWRFSAEYRARIVREADACAEIGEVGSLLRREGLYSPSLSIWRKEYGKAGEAALRDDKRGRKGMKIALKKKLLTASEPRGILGICAGDELCKRDRWSRGQLWERTP